MQNWGRNSFLQHLLLSFDRDDRWCATTFVLCPSLYHPLIACILARARIRTRFNRSFIFLLSQVSHHLLTSRSFTRKQHVVFYKTTRYFHQNDTSFSIKQHVTFTKTTRRFQQNNTLLSPKQHVVFNKTTRYFSVQMKQIALAKTAEP